MAVMVSRAVPQRRRKPPAERREEIIAAAAEIALDRGLEEVKLQTVATRLDVRHGLINHYFPAVDELVTLAFARAMTDERRLLFHGEGSPLERLARLVQRVQSPEAVAPARLWLNARNLSRTNVKLREVLEAEEALDREHLHLLIEQGNETGAFSVADPWSATVQILIAMDGFGAYANNSGDFEAPAYTDFVPTVMEWSLGLPPGAMRELAALRG